MSLKEARDIQDRIDALDDTILGLEKARGQLEYEMRQARRQND